MPTCMLLVFGIVAAPPTGAPSGAHVLDLHAEVAGRVGVPGQDGPVARVGREVGVVAVGAERRLVVVVRRGGREAGVHPRAERPRERLQRRAVGAHGGGGVARVGLRAERHDRAGLQRPARAPVRRERGVGLVLRVVRVRGAEAAPERPQAAGIDDERGIREAGPPALHRASSRRPCPPPRSRCGGGPRCSARWGDARRRGGRRPRCAPGRPGRVLAPSGVVTRFQGAACAAGAAEAAAMITARATTRAFMGASAFLGRGREPSRRAMPPRGTTRAKHTA